MQNFPQTKTITKVLVIGILIVLLNQIRIHHLKQYQKPNLEKVLIEQQSSLLFHSKLPSRPPFSNAQRNEHFQYVVDMSCTMSTCFQWKPCFNAQNLSQEFRVYVYPDILQPQFYPSEIYSKILKVLRSSKYFTTNPNEACVYVPSLDTVDRDPLSTNFNNIAQNYLNKLSHWHIHGENHLIFNMYAGTWPNYNEHEMALPVDRGILVKASFSAANMRSRFDISLPLFHKQHYLFASQNKINKYNFHENRQILLSFKGKRYVRGIGSISRNALFHLHNGNDVIILTTCQHGTDWMRWADERCSLDNVNYDTYNYVDLMLNSTFCLVPRGRRLGSYRFLESLKYGCIPVLLSNDWELPFSDIIDWPQAVVWMNEFSLLQVTDFVRGISQQQIQQYRREGQRLWNQYFQSIDKIVNTVLEIIKSRISSENFLQLWNNKFMTTRFSNFPCDYPMVKDICTSSHRRGFTVILPHSFLSKPFILQQFLPLCSLLPLQRVVIVGHKQSGLSIALPGCLADAHVVFIPNFTTTVFNAIPHDSPLVIVVSEQSTTSTTRTNSSNKLSDALDKWLKQTWSLQWTQMKIDNNNNNTREQIVAFQTFFIHRFFLFAFQHQQLQTVSAAHANVLEMLMQQFTHNSHRL